MGLVLAHGHVLVTGLVVMGWAGGCIALDDGWTGVHACLLMASDPSIHAVWMPETPVSPLFEGVFVPFTLGK